MSTFFNMMAYSSNDILLQYRNIRPRSLLITIADRPNASTSRRDVCSGVKFSRRIGQQRRGEYSELLCIKWRWESITEHFAGKPRGRVWIVVREFLCVQRRVPSRWQISVLTCLARRLYELFIRAIIYYLPLRRVGSLIS